MHLTDEDFEKFYANLATKLSQLRESGVAVTDIADRAGVHVQTVYKYLKSEPGKRPELKTALRLATALGENIAKQLEDLLPKDVVVALQLHEKNPKLLALLVEVLENDPDGIEAEKIISDLNYMRRTRTSPALE